MLYGESGMGSLISTPPPKPNREARVDKPKMRKCFLAAFPRFVRGGGGGPLVVGSYGVGR